MPKDLGSNPSTATAYLVPLNQPPPHPLGKQADQINLPELWNLVEIDAQ